MKRSRHDDNRAYLAMTGRLSKTEMTSNKGSYVSVGAIKARPAGISLKPGAVPGLVAAALAGGGPIKQGEAFEHFLAVVCDSARFYAYHFIIAAPRSAAGRRRAVLLSERTVNGNVAMVKAYAKDLVEYAAALGAPRVMIDETSFCCSLARCLTLEVPNSMVWADARVQWPPTCEGLRGKYLDNYALGFDRYTQASVSKAVQCPLADLLAGQASTMAPKVDEQGRVYLNSPGDKMERELNALCLLYLDEERARLAGESEGALLAS